MATQACDEASTQTLAQAYDGFCGPLRAQWAQAVLLLLAGGIVNFYVPPHDKLVFDHDPQLQFPVGAQQFPEALLFGISFFVPLFVIFAVARGLDRTDFCVSAVCLSQCVGLAMFTTTVAKKIAGRPRPCFYAMCGWVSNSTAGSGTCTAARLAQWESRQSFPSGHSSLSMAGLGFLGMYLLEKCEQLQRPPRFLTVLQLHAAQLCALVPFAVAMWVAISRTVDYWHHYSDVIAGAVLGFGIARVCFSQRGRFRSMLVEEQKRDTRETSDSVDDPMLADRQAEMRDVV
jgi:membrane-associated phospholipid phosphatase